VEVRDPPAAVEAVVEDGDPPAAVEAVVEDGDRPEAVEAVVEDGDRPEAEEEGVQLRDPPETVEVDRRQADSGVVQEALQVRLRITHRTQKKTSHRDSDRVTMHSKKISSEICVKKVHIVISLTVTLPS
jgi:hypothetical protein